MPRGFDQCSLCPHSYLSYLMEKQMDQREMARDLEGTSQVRGWAMLLVWTQEWALMNMNTLTILVYARLTPCSWDVGMRRTLVPVFKEPKD